MKASTEGGGIVFTGVVGSSSRPGHGRSAEGRPKGQQSTVDGVVGRSLCSAAGSTLAPGGRPGFGRQHCDSSADATKDHPRTYPTVLGAACTIGGRDPSSKIQVAVAVEKWKPF
mmetsp:Transcript_72865/g.194522  ORF Transcript_72865/g.194522 Transcript_72865/m.194522 type:complete len:114 (+) Transcript_72865:378-719(+)